MRMIPVIVIRAAILFNPCLDGHNADVRILQCLPVTSIRQKQPHPPYSVKSGLGNSIKPDFPLFFVCCLFFLPPNSGEIFY